MFGIEFREIEKSFADTDKSSCRRKQKSKQRVPALHHFNLSIKSGEFMVLVGPSGCGKSTALRILAGLESPDQGEILIEGRLVTHKEPQQRDVAMVFQNYALYPHMTVAQNLGFPLKMRKQNSVQIKQKVNEVAEMLGLETLLQRKPKQLSGGQRQRVAMGRALVRDPKVLLMDEPLSNLDAKLRVQIRGEIATLQQRTGVTTIYVTHDQAEAMTLGHRVAVLKDGELQQVDTPQQLYDKPKNRFVAQFIDSPGMNIMSAKLTQKEDTFYLLLGDQQVVVPIERMQQIPALLNHVGESILLGLRPEEFCFADSSTEKTGSNDTLTVEIKTVESLGHESLVYFVIPGHGGQNVVRTNAQSRLKPLQIIAVAPNMQSAYFFTGGGDVIE